MVTSSNAAAILLTATLVLAVVGVTNAADESSWPRPRVIQVADEAPVPKAESPPANVSASPPNVVGPAIPAEAAAPHLPGDPTGPPAVPVPVRDPTQPGEQLRDLVAPIRMGQQAGKGGASGISLPQVTLKGRIVGPLVPPAAIVEVDTVLHVLHQGSELTVPTPNVGLGSLTLRVSELTSSEVRIEIMPLRQAIVLR